jgi:hypothetical protein
MKQIDRCYILGICQNDDTPFLEVFPKKSEKRQKIATKMLLRTTKQKNRYFGKRHEVFQTD